MKNEKGFTLIELMIAVSCLIILPALYGFGMNIYKLTQADFEAPYKTEVIRGAGIPFPPLGVIAGYMDIGEENDGAQDR